jgi:hypothetical protein
MKKSIIAIICLLGTLPVAFAQTEAEKMFEATREEFQRNPMKAILESAREDYVLVSGNGYLADKEKTASLFKNVKNVEVSFTNLKVRQIGNTVIVTGNEHSVRHYDDNTPDLVTDYLVTYVYESKNKHLVYVSGQHTKPASK